MVKVGILGYGTVGSGVFEILDKNSNIISKRAGQDIEVKCHFCNTAYTFSVEELKRILKQAKR
mgnify:CR=1 FL=1